jgi:hypothetical protein
MALYGNAFVDTQNGSSDEITELESLNAEIKNMSAFKRFGVYVRFFGLYLLQLFVVLLSVSITRGYLTAILLVASFWSWGTVIKKRYHTDTMMCTMVSVGAFALAAVFTVPFKYSIFSVVISAFAISFGMYRLATHMDATKLYKRFYDDCNKFEIDSCDEATMRQRCSILPVTLSEEKVNMCIDLFVKKLTNKEVAVKYNRAEGTIANKRSQFRKMLMAKIDNNSSVEIVSH